jgi:hypothetical protein
VTRLRVTKIDEFQFLTCLKHGLWGSNSARFKDWKIGDLLVLLVENSVAGLATVSGPPFRSSTTVWDNGLFPHRIPMGFLHATLPANRIRVLGEVRDTLVLGFPVGGGWGLGILNQRLMDAAAAEKLVGFIGAAPNDVAQMRDELDALLASAKLKRDAKLTKKTVPVDKPAPVSAPTQMSSKAAAALADEHAEPEAIGTEAESLHLTAQALLIELGRTVGCSVWVASNDKSKSLAGKPLGLDCLTALPSMGLSGEATKAIGLIDVIWLRKNAPVAAFEVEATTSVHSGLLRMSDLVELVPALRMDLYIVAPRERQAKVLRELARPTFRRIGLSDICRFVALDDLVALLKKLEGLKGFVQPEIIDTIAIALPEQTESALA